MLRLTVFPFASLAYINIFLPIVCTPYDGVLLLYASHRVFVALSAPYCGTLMSVLSAYTPDARFKSLSALFPVLNVTYPFAVTGALTTLLNAIFTVSSLEISVSTLTSSKTLSVL